MGIKCPRLQLHNEIVEFYKVFGPNAKEMHNRTQCFKAVKKAIKRYVMNHTELDHRRKLIQLLLDSHNYRYQSQDFWVLLNQPVCELNSEVSHLLIFSKYYKLVPSDIDIVVSGRIQLMDIHSALEAEQDRFEDCHPLKAKVSLIKGYDQITNIDFDICLNETDGIKGSKMVNEFKKEFPELKYLVVILKILLSIHDLNKTYDGGINSFGLILLVVSYLQQQKKMKAQQEDTDSSTLLSDHLHNFLKLYGVDFNYKKLGISVRKGGFYYDRKDKGFDNGSHARSTLSLESPINTDLNVAIAAHQFHKIIELFKKCYSSLVSTEKQTDLSILNLVLKAT